MTNEEAINWIRLDIDMTKFDPSTGEEAYLNDEAKKVIEALEMAIEALKKVEKIPYKKVEIIHCTECKKCWDSGTATINGQSCRIFKCSVWERPVSPFGYCYMAERRNDG